MDDWDQLAPAYGRQIWLEWSANLLRLSDEGEPGLWTIRPEHVVIGSGERRARVLEAVYRGTNVRLVLDWGGQRVEALVDPAASPAVGSEIAFELPVEQLWRVTRPTASGGPALPQSHLGACDAPTTRTKAAIDPALINHEPVLVLPASAAPIPRVTGTAAKRVWVAQATGGAVAPPR